MALQCLDHGLELGLVGGGGPGLGVDGDVTNYLHDITLLLWL